METNHRKNTSILKTLSEKEYERRLYTHLKETSAKKDVSIQWLGAAGLLVSDKKCSILIDPLVSRYTLIQMRRMQFKIDSDSQRVAHLLNQIDPKKVKAIAVSHSHYDHALDAPSIAKRTGALLIGSQSTANIARGDGVEESQLRIVQERVPIQIEDFTITFYKSFHSMSVFGNIPYPGEIKKPLKLPATVKSFKEGGTYAIHISHPSGSILHLGSSVRDSNLFDGIKADIVVAGIASRESSKQLIEACCVPTEAKLFFPIHFDNFFKPLSSKITFLPGVNFAYFFLEADRYKNKFNAYTLPINQEIPILPIQEE